MDPAAIATANIGLEAIRQAADVARLDDAHVDDARTGRAARAATRRRMPGRATVAHVLRSIAERLEPAPQSSMIETTPSV